MNKITKMLLLAGIVGAGAMVATPAFSETPAQAYASGSSTLVLMNGASISLGGEIAAPAGANFNGNSGNATAVGDVLVTPTIVSNLSLNNATTSALTVSPGLAIAAGAPGASVEAAVAAIVGTGAGPALDIGVSYTRAWKSGLQ